MIDFRKEGADDNWQELVDELVAKGALYTPRIVKAFRDIPRGNFVPASISNQANSLDQALPIGEGQTVSQPTTVATMLELCRPEKGDKILDIGTGSGWQAALLSKITGSEGEVYSVERVKELAQRAKKTLNELGFANIHVLQGDASRGFSSAAPFDVIIAAAETEEVPEELISQLANSGRLLQPISGMGLRVLKKNEEGKISARDVPGFVFVPFVKSGEEPEDVTE